VSTGIRTCGGSTGLPEFVTFLSLLVIP
jgi:hypothetical protein